MTHQLELFQSLDTSNVPVVEVDRIYITNVMFRQSLIIAQLSNATKIFIKGFEYSEVIHLWNFLYFKMTSTQTSKVSFTWKEYLTFTDQDISENAFKIMFEKIRTASIAFELNSNESVVFL